jgi:hypothetical protein
LRTHFRSFFVLAFYLIVWSIPVKNGKYKWTGLNFLLVFKKSVNLNLNIHVIFTRTPSSKIRSLPLNFLEMFSKFSRHDLLIWTLKIFSFLLQSSNSSFYLHMTFGRILRRQLKNCLKKRKTFSFSLLTGREWKRSKWRLKLRRLCSHKRRREQKNENHFPVHFTPDYVGEMIIEINCTCLNTFKKPKISFFFLSSLFKFNCLKENWLVFGKSLLECER